MTVITANPRYRKIMGFIFVAVVLAMAALVQWGLPQFEIFLSRKTPLEAFRITIIFLRSLFVAVLVIVAYFLRFGWRILTSGQWPPPGTSVMRNTEVIEGDPARRKAYVTIIASLIIAIIALVGIFYLPYKLNIFLAPEKLSMALPAVSIHISAQS